MITIRAEVVIVGLFRKHAYTPAVIPGWHEELLFDPTVGKTDFQLATTWARTVAEAPLLQIPRDRTWRGDGPEDGDLAKGYFDPLLDTAVAARHVTLDQRDLLAEAFMYGWQVGVCERVSGLNKPQLMSQAATTAIALLKQAMPTDVSGARQFLMAGYLAFLAISVHLIRRDGSIKGPDLAEAVTHCDHCGT